LAQFIGGVIGISIGAAIAASVITWCAFLLRSSRLFHYLSTLGRFVALHRARSHNKAYAQSRKGNNGESTQPLLRDS
jgi:hypothetical protein